MPFFVQFQLSTGSKYSNTVLLYMVWFLSFSGSMIHLCNVTEPYHCSLSTKTPNLKISSHSAHMYTVMQNIFCEMCKNKLRSKGCEPQHKKTRFKFVVKTSLWNDFHLSSATSYSLNPFSRKTATSNLISIFSWLLRISIQRGTKPSY